MASIPQNGWRGLVRVAFTYLAFLHLLINETRRRNICSQNIAEGQTCWMDEATGYGSDSVSPHCVDLLCESDHRTLHEIRLSI
ncbi:hypothetical protein ARMGADRAFT_1012797 [Armillaria gallica]|uniref:Uncharacterized protein n=1 Tax=Armillaria gallica TaxID=47427 RepID=A0A2H3DXS1_ARMGA|nr:hypothetical protein ARMGADRAFT_1012797 [Armillaria gallica]